GSAKLPVPVASRRFGRIPNCVFPNHRALRGDSVMRTYRSKKSGFTLVEILIVVIILGILAAIVIPQFTNASQDARKNSTTSLLQTIRSQIELYKLQHSDTLPALTTNWNALVTTST